MTRWHFFSFVFTLNDLIWIFFLQEAFVSSDEFGSDLEHVEVLQRKFDEFQKDMAAQEFRVTEVLDLADRLVKEGHPEEETINRRKEVNLFFISECKYFLSF